MSEYDKNQIVGSLLMIRKADGLDVIGDWSVGLFELPESDVTEATLLELFSEMVNLCYRGDKKISSVMIKGEYLPKIFFLIPTEHKGEFGRHLFSFQILDES
ncbi:hypothetical protein LAT59_04270 [Candidatus Gracilibacteria bacterium]|nr:hypothetical protein [Candidatus Gracilibacteria bacterium]